MSEAVVSQSHEDVALRALLRGTKHLITLLAPDGSVLWVSPSVELVLGYEPADVLGHNVAEYLHPDDLAFALTFFDWSGANAMDGGLERDDAGIAFDLRLRHRNGRWMTIEGLTNNFLADPDIGGLLIIGRDVTARRILEEALTALAHGMAFADGVSRALSFLDARISGTSAAVWWPDNEPAWTTASVPENLLAAEGPWQELPAGVEYVVFEDLKAALANGDLPRELVRQAVDAGFSSLWCLPVPPDNPTLGSYLSVHPEALPPASTASGALVVWSRFQPVPLFGHRYQLEHVATLVHFAMVRRALEIQQASQLEEERRQNERLAELETLRSDLVMAVSHDLRTPLTSIIGAADMLAEAEAHPDEVQLEERATYVDLVGRNAHRLLDMIDDLLFLAQLDSGVLPTTRSAVDVGALVADSVEGLRPAAQAKGVALEVEVHDGPELLADHDRLHQLFDNLVANALKYTPEGGHVRVVAGPRPAGGWEVTVADDGIGIPLAEQEAVFDRFGRGSNARDARITGTGLGLVIAQAVAKLHGGWIGLESEEGRGATFTALLGNLAA